MQPFTTPVYGKGENPMVDPDGRRPLASRDTGWARWLTVRLAERGITPNQISQASMVAAALACAAFYFADTGTPTERGLMLLAAALFCQLRLLCNLLDGMVAVEAGKGAKDGPFWNEFPDRVSDILILVGVGYGVGEPVLGWTAAAFAVMTAYTRELGRTCGLEADFCGPMAKPHRMALVTVATVVSIFDWVWGMPNSALVAALWLVSLGALLTSLRRAVRLIQQLKTPA